MSLQNITFTLELSIMFLIFIILINNIICVFLTDLRLQILNIVTLLLKFILLMF